MSRVIKFRAWNEEENHMIDAAELAHSMCSVTLPDETKRMVSMITFAMIVPDAGFVLEQFTGLQDSKGRDIYEGDIIESENACYAPRAVVVYAEHEVRFAPCEIESYVMGKRDGDLFNQPGEPWLLSVCTVIGNIHENPTLLESTP